MAVMDSNGNRLTLPDISPPTPICRNPSNAEAVPAFFEKGAMQSAAAFGYVIPQQESSTKRKAITAINPYHPFIEPTKKKIWPATPAP